MQGLSDRVIMLPGKKDYVTEVKKQKPDPPPLEVNLPLTDEGESKVWR